MASRDRNQGFAMVASQLLAPLQEGQLDDEAAARDDSFASLD